MCWAAYSLHFDGVQVVESEKCSLSPESGIFYSALSASVCRTTPATAAWLAGPGRVLLLYFSYFLISPAFMVFIYLFLFFTHDFLKDLRIYEKTRIFFIEIVSAYEKLSLYLKNVRGLKNLREFKKCSRVKKKFTNLKRCS